MEPKFIELRASNPQGRLEEWAKWKCQGYRILDPSGHRIWHESEAIKTLVLEIFAECDADIFLFGSRAVNQETARSDYDIGYHADQPPSPSKLAQLQETLEEWPIPAKVDLVDFRNVPCEFKSLALKKVKIWKRKTKNSLFTSKP